MSALGWAAEAAGSFRGPGGLLFQAHSIDHNLVSHFDNMTLPMYQTHADYLIPLGKILEFTYGPQQKKSVLLNHLFPTFQSLEGEMLVSFYPLFEIPSAQSDSPYLLNRRLQEILSLPTTSEDQVTINEPMCSQAEHKFAKQPGL